MTTTTTLAREIDEAWEHSAEHAARVLLRHGDDAHEARRLLAVVTDEIGEPVARLISRHLPSAAVTVEISTIGGNFAELARVRRSDGRMVHEIDGLPYGHAESAAERYCERAGYHVMSTQRAS